ncbi:MAG: hypothetical protein ABJA87_10985 [bacterium]
MNVVARTVLVFVGIPLALVLLLVVGVYGRTLVHQNRYRPGRPWTYPPVWYVPHPQQPHANPEGRLSLSAASTAVSVNDGNTPAPRMGGASGEW